MTRIIAGFILTPLLGPLIYHSLLSILLGDGNSIDNVYISSTLSYIGSVISRNGSLLYPPAVIFSLVIMLFIRRIYCWNIISCTIGAMLSALSVGILVMFLIWVTGSEFRHASFIFYRFISMIAVPSVVSGLFFWFFGVCGNECLKPIEDSRSEEILQPVQ